MRPADAREFLVAITRLFSFAKTFGLPTETAETATKFYRSGMAHVPADLVVLAVDRAVADHRWSNRLPLPADLIALIQAELDDRRTVLIRLETIDRQARKAAHYDRGELDFAREDPEERARRKAAVDEILRGLPQVAGI